MKVVKSEKEVFRPITIILESQEEVDKVYALFNNLPISEAIGLGSWYKELTSFKTSEYNEYHTSLMCILKNK